MIDRVRQLERLLSLLRAHPVVAILGARQVGKTTLARDVAAARGGPATFHDLEDPVDLARLADPMLALAGLRGLVILDEIQRRPDLFPVLRVLCDRPRPPSRFLVLGSASPDLLRQSSESLAGRIVYHELTGFSMGEIGAERQGRLWLRGGFPRSFLARSEGESRDWRRAFIRTFLERDIPQLGIGVASATLGRFWSMLAHYHAQTWNAAEFARSFGVSDMSVRRYLDVLTSTFAVRQLLPWTENIRKRQVKSPRVYLSDTGLLHTLLGIEDQRGLEGHPKIGASWEGFAMEVVIDRLGARRDECFFWRTQGGAELDLLVVRGRSRWGFEIKRTSTPQVTPSMRSALTDLRLGQIDVVHGGRDTFPLAPRIRALSLSRILTDLAPLR